MSGVSGSEVLLTHHTHTHTSIHAQICEAVAQMGVPPKGLRYEEGVGGAAVESCSHTRVNYNNEPGIVWNSHCTQGASLAIPGGWALDW